MTDLVDHFLCYKAIPARGAERFRSLDKSEREVTLTNQFEVTGKDVDLVRTEQYCDAVNKNGEGLLDPAARLTCYSVRQAPSSRVQVITTDQFGDHELNVKRRPTQLCVPSQEVVAPSDLAATGAAIASLDHFELYKAGPTPNSPRFEKTDVNLVDEFWSTSVELKKPVALGVPTDKNSEGISHPSAHLTCYSMRAPRFPITDVEVTNQFGQFELTVRRPTMLCVPSFKQVVSDD